VELALNFLSVFPGFIMVAAAVTVLIIRSKIKNTELEMRGSNAELRLVVDELRDDFEQLADTQEQTRAQLAEVQDRLDFAERLLSAGRASQEDISG
jgi:hypothetical protein